MKIINPAAVAALDAIRTASLEAVRAKEARVRVWLTSAASPAQAPIPAELVDPEDAAYVADEEGDRLARVTLKVNAVIVEADVLAAQVKAAAQTVLDLATAGQLLVEPAPEARPKRAPRVVPAALDCLERG